MFPVGDITMFTIDAHYRGAEFAVRIALIEGVAGPVLQLDGNGVQNMINVFLSEEQIDQVGEAILTHQGQRKNWSTTKVIGNQLQEVTSGKSCLG